MGPDSLLKQVNDEYGGNINKLSGGVTDCALTGNGNPALANAEYRINVVPSNVGLYDAILDNIGTKWAANYPGTGHSYQAECRARVDPFNQANVANFIATVLTEFSQAPGDGIAAHSTNYHDLIELNTGGNPLSTCGASPAGNAVEVPCP